MKKISFICLGILFLFSFTSVNASSEFSVNQAIDNVSNISLSFSTKISGDILTLERVDEITKNRLLVDFQNYLSSLEAFSTDIINAEDQEQFFNDILEEYMALSKVLSMYKSNDSLFNLIESNYTLLNTIDAYIQDFNLPSEVTALTQESRDVMDQLEADIVNGVTNTNTGILYSSLLSVNDELDFSDYQRIVIVSDSHLSSYKYFKTKYLTESTQSINNINSILSSAAEFSPHRSSISTNRSSMEINGFSTVSVKVLSYSNLPFENTELTLRSLDANVTISPAMQKLNENGVANFKIESKALGKINLEALIEGRVILSANDIIDVYEISEENSTMVASPGVIDIGEVSKVTVIVKDNSGRILRGIRVGLTVGNEVLLDFESIITDKNGLAVFELTGNKYSTINISASLNQKTLLVEGIIQVISPEEQACIDDARGTWKINVCDCGTGYVWNDNQKACITDEEQACIDDSIGKWIDDKCYCGTGYAWDTDKCITQEEKDCNDDLIGKWIDDKCYCGTGYAWDTDKCITQEEKACNDDSIGKWIDDKCDCGSGYAWDTDKCITQEEKDCNDDVIGIWKITICDCGTGYAWDTDKCITDEEQACNDDPIGTWNGTTCECDGVFTWNEEKMFCEKVGLSF